MPAHKNGAARDLWRRARHYGGIAAGGLGLTGSRALSGPLWAQISIADPCNHKCVMCWEHPPDGRENPAIADRFGGDRQGIMSLDVFKGVVDDLYAMGTRKVALVGRGEPLLNRKAIDMIEYAKGIGMDVHLVSNGSKVTSELAERMVAAGLDRIQFSLNAGRPETYPRIHVTETPESYVRNKANMALVARARRSAGSEKPFIRVGFVIGRANWRELVEMVEAAHEIGADEAMFSHLDPHPGIQDLTLSDAEYDEMLAGVSEAMRRSEELGISTTLKSFRGTVPAYKHDRMRANAVVPCYAGWFFSLVLGNGEVMGCCHCSRSLGKVTEGVSFRDVWNSPPYRAFRSAARKLPRPSPELEGCTCDKCMMRPHNISMHNFLHPWSRIAVDDRDGLFRIADLAKKRKSDRD